MFISIIIPSFRRPEALNRCLKGLKEQTRPADEILVIIRKEDVETLRFLNEVDMSAFRRVIVDKPGQVYALNAGLDEAKGDIIVFADDDSIPKDTWLEQIEKHFLMDDKIGGVGGRDFVYIDNQSIKGKKRNVGTITWYGRVIGNHHLGFNSPREVDHLKGANMGFRREAIGELRFDEHLRGSGAQYRNDLALCLAVKQKGWKLIYDPQVAADHYYSKRFDEDQRGIFNPDATRDLAHNEIYVFLKYMHGIRRPVCILFTLLVGSTAAPGMAQFLRLLLRGHKKVWSRFLASIQGQCEGYKTWRTSLVKKKHFKYGKG